MSEMHVHELVLETAEAMCHEVYDALMQKNDWYDLWKRQHPGMGPKGLESTFVRKNRLKYVEAARATLAGMLAQPIDSQLKETIYEALLRDKSLVRGREGRRPLFQ